MVLTHLILGLRDGTAAEYGLGDVWVVRYHYNELDDGVQDVVVGTQVNIGKFLTGELLKGKDVVMWYEAHFKHDQTHEGGDHIIPHVVGPDLKPVIW